MPDYGNVNELITVVVCSVGDAGTGFGACIDALARAGMTDPVVLKSDSGIASLRNEALAACQTPVIAFVDDDVVVGVDWFKVLAAEWSTADPRTACIGGPLFPEAHPDSPSWLSDEVVATSSANTPSDPGSTQDESARTFCGGNVSFRTDALAGIGGFWPAAGAGRARDWYSEEHHAQRELARVGWEARLSTGAAARRVVGPDAHVFELATGQARTGARRSLVGGSDSRELTQALRSASGALVAGATLRPALAAERLIRAAGHAGTFAPQLVGGRTLAPNSGETPFRHSVPSANTGKRRATSRGKPAAYCYHRVTDEEVPSGLSVTTSEFRRHLEALLSRGKPAPLADISAGDAPSGSFAITFDDGYADNLHVALPILDELGVPATFFITTGHVQSGRSFWWDRVARLLDSAKSDERDRGILEISCSGQTRAWAPTSTAQLDSTHRHIVSWFQSQMPEAIEDAVGQLESWTNEKPDLREDRPMTPDELLQLTGHPLVTVGAHTRTHANLRFCEPNRLADELSGARHDLTQMTGAEVRDVAYPFGVWGADVDARVAAAAAGAGYATGVLNGGAPKRPNALATPRETP